MRTPLVERRAVRCAVTVVEVREVVQVLIVRVSEVRVRVAQGLQVWLAVQARFIVVTVTLVDGGLVWFKPGLAICRGVKFPGTGQGMEGITSPRGPVGEKGSE